MSQRSPTRRVRSIEFLLALLGGSTVAWLLSVLLVQVAYGLLPASPSETSIRLEQEANQRPPLFENGFRYAGFVAPVGMDPLAFGRCVHPDAEERAQQALAGKELPYRSRADTEALVTQCLHGQARLELPAPGPDDWAKGSWTQEDWLTLARTTPDPVLMERAEEIWRQGHLRLGIDFDRPPSQYAPLAWLAQWRMASAVAMWREGRRDEALQTWATSAEHAMSTTGDELVETMVSVSTLTRLLLSLQTAIRSSETLDEASATKARQIADLVDNLPQATHRSLISEWQGLTNTLQGVDSGVREKWQARREKDQASQDAKVYALSYMGLIYDPVDSVNQHSVYFEGQRAAMLAAALGQEPDDISPWRPCAWLGRFWHVCRPHERNPLGRWMVRQPSSYISYGTRIADLRNLAAATRLSVEARRQGLRGEALARFVTQAPEGMRDVFTQQPFAYNTRNHKLVIPLRAKSPVLGAPGRYELVL